MIVKIISFIACCRLTSASLSRPATSTARRLYEYAWHESAVNVLQSPAMHTGYQFFGNAISADQDLVMIGAPGDNIMTFYGSVSVFETRTFELVDYLVSDNQQKGDQFGGAVAISGWDGLIGAHRYTISHLFIIYMQRSCMPEITGRTVSPEMETSDWFIIILVRMARLGLVYRKSEL